MAFDSAFRVLLEGDPVPFQTCSMLMLMLHFSYLAVEVLPQSPSMERSVINLLFAAQSGCRCYECQCVNSTDLDAMKLVLEGLHEFTVHDAMHICNPNKPIAAFLIALRAKDPRLT